MNEWLPPLPAQPDGLGDPQDPYIVGSGDARLYLRPKDNLHQTIAILVFTLIGAAIGFIVCGSDARTGGAAVGGILGLVVGFFASGIFLMLSRVHPPPRLEENRMDLEGLRMSPASGKCAICAESLKPIGNGLVCCPVCRVFQHKDCWIYNGGRCAVYGCAKAHAERDPLPTLGPDAPSWQVPGQGRAIRESAGPGVS